MQSRHTALSAAPPSASPLPAAPAMWVNSGECGCSARRPRHRPPVPQYAAPTSPSRRAPVRASAPHVAGLAALLVAQLGHGNPALIRARILQSADDLGDPGVDPYYGKGRINVARALGLIN